MSGVSLNFRIFGLRGLRCGGFRWSFGWVVCFVGVGGLEKVWEWYLIWFIDGFVFFEMVLDGWLVCEKLLGIYFFFCVCVGFGIGGW